MITLDQQDRSAWIQAEIDQSNALLDVAVLKDAPGPYHMHAPIAACHANATRRCHDWAGIAALYERRVEVTANPLVKLRHAVAVGMASSPEDALTLLGRIRTSFATTPSCTRLTRTPAQAGSRGITNMSERCPFSGR